MIDFDNLTRAIAFGHSNSVSLYKATSCGLVISHINKPFMIVKSKDDPISLQEDVPRDILLQNKNCILVESDYGGHCDFFSATGRKEEKYRRFFLDLVVKYIDDIDRINNK